MVGWQIVFWISCGIVFYNYAGYAMIVYLLNRFNRSKEPTFSSPEPGSAPPVAFIVAAYNEEDCINQKIINSLAQDYPKDRIRFYFITDGSTDKTMEIIRKYPSIQLLHQPERRGKSAALNRVVQQVSEDLLVISDANTILNPDATTKIIRHYKDTRIGGVAGEKKVLPAPGAKDEVGSGEGLYWKYESALKKLDSDFYSVVGAAGELFSLRKQLYIPIDHNTILDDFVLSLRAAQSGYRIRYEPEAYAMELPSFSIKDEQKRKIRIAAGGFQAIGMLLPLLAFWRTPRLSFLYISHRVLRWTLSPIGFILALLSNAILALTIPTPLYIALFAGQLLFYGLAAAAALIPAIQRFKPAKLASYFVFMNISVILGFFRFLRGRQTATWEKARRAQAINRT